jgi:predicted ArsR family transcriptional regulator
MTPTERYVLTLVDQHGPITARRLADIACWEEPRAGKALRELTDEGLLCIAGTIQHKRGRPAYVYAESAA